MLFNEEADQNGVFDILCLVRANVNLFFATLLLQLYQFSKIIGCLENR